MSKTVEEIIMHTGIGNCGNPFCTQKLYTVDESVEAIDQLLIEARLEENNRILKQTVRCYDHDQVKIETPSGYITGRRNELEEQLQQSLKEKEL